ncbi:indole-3-glycerol phosphate synthase TrpC [Candidatus Omnitrophota bacterium]
MNDTLKEIIAKKKQYLVQRMEDLPRAELISRIAGIKPTLSFSKSINKSSSISLIAEIKKASPSQGVIREDFNPGDIAAIYKESGVQAISVLTEEDYFLGNIDYVRQVKSIANLPVLRKDFIIQPYQIYESRAFGCDALLLIAEALSQETLSEFLALAGELNLDCLVEIHTEKDLKKALKAKAELIGINNRDLHSLKVDFEATQRLYPLIPKEKIVVVESGIKRYSDILFLKVLGVKAVLIGTAFMQAEDIKDKIKEVMGW